MGRYKGNRKSNRNQIDIMMAVCNVAKQEATISDIIFGARINNYAQMKKLIDLCVKYDLIGIVNKEPNIYLIKVKGRQLLELFNYGYNKEVIPELA